MLHFDLTVGDNPSTISVLNECMFCSVEMEVIMNRNDYDRWKYFRFHAKDVWPEVKPEIRDVLIVPMCPDCSKHIFEEAEEIHLCVLCDDVVEKVMGDSKVCLSCKQEIQDEH